MKAREAMTKDPACCSPEDTLQDVARMMRECDCGMIPVAESRESKKLVGTITDRDIAVRAVAEGRGAETRVREAMSKNPIVARPDDDLQAIERKMADNQIRRVPIVDDQGNCIGVVAQADLARLEGRGVSDREVGEMVEKISEPTDRPRA